MKAIWIFIQMVCKMVLATIIAIGRQLLAIITDPQWDIDGPKLAGILTVSLGITIMVACLIKWDFNGPAPMYGMTLVTTGLGLLGWRGHTENSVGK